jgi:hypothetical protein
MVGSLGPGLNNRRSAAAHARAAAVAAALRGGSIAFNGSSNYLNLSTDADLQFGTGNWTVEFFVKLNSTTSGTLFDWRPTSTNGAYPYLYVTNGKINYFVNNTIAITGTVTLTAGTWYHVAVSKGSGSTRLYIAGNQDGTTYSDSVNYSAGFLTIGKQSFTSAGFLNGNLTNYRVTKGQALYVSNFGVPNAPMTAGANTKLLLLASASGTALADSSGLNKTVTNNGTTWSNTNPF